MTLVIEELVIKTRLVGNKSSDSSCGVEEVIENLIKENVSLKKKVKELSEKVDKLSIER